MKRFTIFILSLVIVLVQQINAQITVLIIDLDGNTNSGPVIQTTIQSLGINVEYVTEFPASLNSYSSVFVCLGAFADNTILTSDQGLFLANYLNSGGSLYMEGADTWYYDAPTAVHTMFNIEGIDDGLSDISLINGQAGTFTEGMSFSYSGDNNWVDHLEPVAPAVKIFVNLSPLYGTGVAYDAGTYKTIGSSHEFGGLNNGTYPSTKQDLMNLYLNFFEIPALAPPIATIASNIQQTSFQANWNTSVAATGYKLDVAMDDSFDNFVPGYNNKGGF
jgi:hypothetical protein